MKEGFIMKGFLSVLTSLLVLPAFADVAPTYYDEIVEYTDEMIENVDNSDVVHRSAGNRMSSSRSSAQRSGITVRGGADSSQNTQKTTNRTTVSRTTNNIVSPRSTSTTSTTSATRTSAPRSGIATRGGTVVQPEKTATSAAMRARIGANTVVVPVSSKKSVNKSNEDSENTSDSSARMASTRRASTMRIATPVTSTPVDVATTTANLSALAELTDYCKKQYASCMDNYCNVLDDNQGRCTCSKNVKSYEKVEEALAQASSEFQDVVQKIKYIGLTGDQVASLFEETEAEIVMANNKDNSKLISSLDSIKRKIIDASSPTSSSSIVMGNNLSLDMSGLLNFDLSSAFDLSAFLNNGNQNTTTSVTNQRGEQLYKSAVARCKVAVLDSCIAQGVEGNVVVNAYDLEIDKHCVIYERNLNEANDEMRNNVRNAGIILQQARLMLAQNKNSYDFRGCVAAIDACMQDEYVCGADYELCLDPTGKYIANGEIVKGGTPGVAGGTVVNNQVLIENESTMSSWQSGGMYELYATWNYGPEPSYGEQSSDGKNAWGGGQDETLGAYIDENLASWARDYAKTSGQEDKIARFLLQKIGYVDANGKTHGMCSAALKQCQDYTYTTTGTRKSSKASKPVYNPTNDVIRQYLQTTLIKIKTQQDEILANYAEDCQSEVTSCLSSNGFEDDKPGSYASTVALGSCRTEIQTCMSVLGQKPTDNTGFTFRAMRDWLKILTMNCNENYYVYEDPSDHTVTCRTCGPMGVNNIMTYSAGGNATRCSCPSEYTDVTDDAGTLIDCSRAQCQTNYYLKYTAVAASDTTPAYSYYTCEQCPSGSTSDGTTTTCNCGEGYVWSVNSSTYEGSCVEI